MTKRIFSAGLFSVFLITISSAICPAVETPPNTGQKLDFYFGLPAKQVYSKSLVDSPRGSYVFDPVLQFDKVTHDFTVRNTSNAVLEFKKVEGCCGSLVEAYTARILPGKEGAIRVILFTDRRGGEEINGTVRAWTNDPKHPEWIIDISCLVKKFADISAFTIMLNGSLQNPIEGSSIIIPTAEFPFRITGIKARKGLDFACGYKETKQAGKKGYIIWAKNKRQEPGVIWDAIYVQTNNKARPEFIIRVQGKITD